MKTRRLPIINYFPLFYSPVQRQPNPFLFRRTDESIEEPPRPTRLTLSKPIDFAKCAARHMGFCGSLDMDIEHHLEQSDEYSEWLHQMPSDANAREILRSRVYNVDRINLFEEFSGLPTLSPGQTLFHGGDWPEALEIGSETPVNFFLSTSLTAVTAAAHATDSGKKEIGPYHVWVIEIGESFVNSVYAFDIFSDNDWRHEMEVLISPNFFAKLIDFEAVGDFIFLKVVFESRPCQGQSQRSNRTSLKAGKTF